MKSMTGFGKADYMSENGTLFLVEVFSLNRKQLEIKTCLPKEAVVLEAVVRTVVASKISRGTVTVKLTLQFSQHALQNSIQINDSVIDNYLKKIRNLQEKHGLAEKIDLVGLMSLPASISEMPPSINSEKDDPAFRTALENALFQLDEMRTNEGNILKEDLTVRLSKLEDYIVQIEDLSAKAPERQKQLFHKRLSESGLDIDLNDERILKEIAIFCDKFDTSEEIIRLKSHFIQFRKFLDRNDSAGRSLDFLIQEMLREINTLGNKTPLVEITFIIVAFKTDLEKIREQVQNIE